jgi:hypothetical protein
MKETKNIIIELTPTELRAIRFDINVSMNESQEFV